MDYNVPESRIYTYLEKSVLNLKDFYFCMWWNSLKIVRIHLSMLFHYDETKFSTV